MGRKLPPLNALRAFEVAARTGNFTKAAKSLNVSQGAVSRHVAQLEAFLGLRLFVRGQRDVKLTPQGVEYANVIREAFDRIEFATQAKRRDTQNRVVRIRLFPTVAMKWLIGRLGRFHALHPTINVQVTIANVSWTWEPKRSTSPSRSLSFQSQAFATTHCFQSSCFRSAAPRISREFPPCESHATCSMARSCIR
ncbi:MAG: LysR family transcriptional regulator, glycine cleavage system transcriptional activator [Bradyrhizobium sp.]|jgi:hypothetical protein|nr:LysR family transcriptional regulator, glycine cleavage system transcriptional activator [Bradyrhizobium sp.]